ncbi:MAG: carboxypeptidase M32 [Thermoflexales bacterium]|nr:carboxypeptidase M32 [Thermoflexales bacterium]
MTHTAMLADLKLRLAEIDDLNRVGAILGWDQSTYLPSGGGAARGRQSATLARIAQEKATDKGLGRLLDDLAPYEASLPADHDDAALIRVARRNYLKAIKLPVEFVGEFQEHASAMYMRWMAARPANDFASLVPGLERTLDFSRRAAEYFAPYEHIADPLIDYADQGMKARGIRAVFAELRAGLAPLAAAILSRPPADDSCIKQPFDTDKQLAFGKTIIEAYGFDFSRGRQDFAPHPFCTTFSVDDVRITTRVKPNDLTEALFSTLHEAGHAMYEQGGNPAYEGTSLQGGTSAGVHESQSRTWENIVGRSRAMWIHFYPRLQAVFPAQLGDVPLDVFHRAINKVERSLIRTDADEVTYNLHVMIRFDLELDLLEGKLAVRDLPQAWNARYASDLGITAPDDRDGCLQDMHWYAGLIGGAFQGYTLGNIISGQFMAAARAAMPDLDAQIASGHFAGLHGWLRENLYQHASKYTANELLQRITGGPLSVGPYLAYLRGKYSPLFDLS